VGLLINISVTGCKNAELKTSNLEIPTCRSLSFSPSSHFLLVHKMAESD